MEVEERTFANRIDLIRPLPVAFDVASDLDTVFKLVFEDVDLRKR